MIVLSRFLTENYNAYRFSLFHIEKSANFSLARASIFCTRHVCDICFFIANQQKSHDSAPKEDKP